jgi:hypothetical protein
MMPDKDRRMKQSVSRAPKLIWMITLLGLGGGIIMLGIIYWTLIRIHDQREELDIFRADMAHLITSLDTYLSQGREDIGHMLRGEFKSQYNALWVKKLEELISSQKSSKEAQHADIRDILGQFELRFHIAADLRDKTAHWNDRHSTFVSVFPAVRKAVESSLSKMRGAIMGIEGRQRLQRAVQIREYRKSPGEIADVLACAIIANIGRDTDIFTVKTELADLALLYERLVGEDQIDNLVDLKDNRFKPTLDRLRRGILNLERRTASDLTVSMLDDFEQNIFGAGFEFDHVHQTIIPRRDGLYMLCREKLLLDQDWEVLQRQMTGIFDEIRIIRGNLVFRADAIADQTAKSAENALNKAWQSMVWIWLASMSVFLFLSVKIARNIRHQIQAIEETNENLKIEIHERGRMEDALRHSQEALEKAKQELEIRVEERTRELQEANARLKIEIEEKQRAEEGLRAQGKELSKALEAARKARQIAESERDRSEKMLTEATEYQRRLEILLSDATAREKRMIELKSEVNDLLKRMGEEIKYEAPLKVEKFLSGGIRITH